MEYMLSSCKFVQCNNVVNASGWMLGEVLSREARCRQPLVKKDSYYPALGVTFDFPIVLQSDKNADVKITYCDFPKGNFFLLYSLLSEVDYSDLYQFDDEDKAVDYFYESCICIDSCVPKKKHMNSCMKFPVWFDHEY